MDEKSKTAVIDIGFSGFIVSESCFKKLKLKKDEKMDFKIIFTTSTSKKKCKLMINLSIEIRSSKVFFISFYEGLYYNVLLGINCLTVVKALINLNVGVLKLGKKAIKYKN